MCGLAVLIAPRGLPLADHIRPMCDIVLHRGPDGEGYAFFAGDEVWRGDGPDTPPSCRTGATANEGPMAQAAFGHRRLSIVDVSAAGHQPMSSADERYWIVFNGEIYNHIELREQLQDGGYAFRTQSDTEVILAAYDRWGPECLNRFNGMFSLVLLDRKAQHLFAARDRFGVKPLYYWQTGEMLAFASEIKQFTVLPGWQARLNGQSAYDYLNWGLSDHTGATLFAGVRQVPAGSYINVGLDEATCDILPRRWYNLRKSAATVDGDVVEAWRQRFLDAVQLRLRADVPVGTALSGGLDSSSIVCVVSLLRRRFGIEAAQNSFSARTHEPAFDEGVYADAVARQADVVAHDTYPTSEGLFEALSDLAWHMDEPFGSTSVFAEWCVFNTVHKTPVKVTLDGHGADEILAGYTASAAPYLADLLRYGKIATFIHEMRALLRSRRHSLKGVMAGIVDELAPKALAAMLRRRGGYASAMPDWLDLQQLNAIAGEPFKTDLPGHGLRGASILQLERTSLPMQLRWNDRNSMAHSIESRAPFLDVNLVEFTLGLRDNLKLENGTTKVIMRRALADLLPPIVVQRQDKVGFATPEQNWIIRDNPDRFRQLAYAALSAAGPIFTTAARRRVDDMISGRRRFDNSLWRIISFGAWLRRFDVSVQ